MIDKLVGKASNAKHSRKTRAYDPSRAVKYSQVINENADRLTVILPPWHGIEYMKPLLKRRAEQLGTALLVFSLDDRILSSNVAEVRDSFEQASGQAIDDIDAIRGDYKDPEIHLVGFSLGNITMALMASQLEGQFRATFVIGSSNLAAAVLRSSRTQHLRDELRGKEISPQELIDAWQPLAPATHAHSFAGRKVSQVISTTDTVIPTYFQNELADSLVLSGADLSMHYTRLGHVRAIANFALRGEL